MCLVGSVILFIRYFTCQECLVHPDESRRSGVDFFSSWGLLLAWEQSYLSMKGKLDGCKHV